jgi:uncharacterized protein YndB with AHSA1/START domain
MAEPREPGPEGIRMTRVFEAPRELVWREWTDPEAFADWFGGPEYEVPLDTVSMLVGPDRREIHWKGVYRVVEEPERLVFTLSDRPGDAYELITVVLTELGGGRTEMLFTQHGHMTPEQYENAAQGWGGFFDRIDERLFVKHR